MKIGDSFAEEELHWIIKNKRFLVWAGRGWWEEHTQPHFPVWTLPIISLSPKQIIIIPLRHETPFSFLGRQSLQLSPCQSVEEPLLKTQPKAQLSLCSFLVTPDPKTLFLPDPLTTICFRPTAC